MSKTKFMIISLTLAAILWVVNVLLPAQPPAPNVQATSTINCPAHTDKGAYFVRSIDENGNVVCGFTFYEACPYTEAVAADDPLCEKSKPVQVQRFEPYEELSQPQQVRGVGK